MIYKIVLKGLDCEHCTKRLEEKIKNIDVIKDATISFESKECHFSCDEEDYEHAMHHIEEILEAEEDDVSMDTCDHEHCDCHHHHHHEEEKATYYFSISGIDCANCAAKLEEKIKGIDGLSDVSLSYINESLQYTCDHDAAKDLEEKVRALALKEEPDATLIAKGHKHKHEHDHDHYHDHHEKEYAETKNTNHYRISGFDCADCAARVERKIAQIEGITNVSISYINNTLRYDCDPSNQKEIHKNILEVIQKNEPDVIVEDEVIEKRSQEEESDTLMILRLVIGAILFIASIFLKDTYSTIAALLSYIVLGYDILMKAVKNIGRGQVFDENFLMSIATIAAIYLKDYREAAGVMLFYQIGEYFQDRAVRTSRKNIASLMDMQADSVFVKEGNDIVEKKPEEVLVGDLIIVKAGEKIPLDGIVVEGRSSLNTASLTGETVLKDVDVNDAVMGGSINESGVLTIQVTNRYEDSTVMRILKLIEESDSKKASQEKFITKFSKYYTPIVVISAIVVAIIVGIITNDYSIGVKRACAFLVISCPCALVISIPLSFFAGIGGLSKKGILVKGASVIETLSKTNHVVMDKTGTITTGQFKVEDILDAKDKEMVLENAAYVENYSNHPLAISIKEAYGKEIDQNRIKDVKEVAGRGMQATIDGKYVLVGNEKLLEDNQIEYAKHDEAGAHIYVAIDGTYQGCIILKDQIKDNVADTFKQLEKEGIQTSIVSGDAKNVVKEVSETVNANAYYAQCLPEDKVNIVKQAKEKSVVAFVGDGINDAPVLVNADVGLAMGAIGSDAAIEASDVVLMDDSLNKVSLAIQAAKRIIRVANENIYGAIFIKIATLILSAFGIANMWMAIFADTGVALLCVLNSLRLMSIKE